VLREGIEGEFRSDVAPAPESTLTLFAAATRVGLNRKRAAR